MNRTNTSPRGISEKNRKKVTILHRGVTGPFTPVEAAGLLNIDISRSRRFLAYLADKGWLTRIRSGLYSAISLDVVEPSSWKEDPWIIAAKVLSPFYIGGWSACEHWGLTEQVFKDTVVFTSHVVRRRYLEIQGTPFIVKTVRNDKLFGAEVVWRGRTRVFVSDPARTVVDILDDPGIGGGIRNITDVLEAYLSHSKRNDSLLLEYTHKLGNKTVFKRLGYLLETLSASETNLVEECRKAISSGFSLLDPTAVRKGRITRRWNLQLNVNLSPGYREHHDKSNGSE